MGRVVVLGEPPQVLVWALAGAVVRQARTDAEVRAAWSALPDDVDVAVLTPHAAAVLGPAPAGPVTVVLP